MREQMQIVDERVATCATIANFCEIFTEEMRSLYLLSFLLTADTDKAEQCFLHAMEECVEGADVFMEWARSWARRAVSKHAIRMIMPEPDGSDSLPFFSAPMGAENIPFAAIF